MHCLGLFKFKFNFHKFIRHFHNHNRSQKGLIKLVEHKLFPLVQQCNSMDGH